MKNIIEPIQDAYDRIVDFVVKYEKQRKAKKKLSRVRKRAMLRGRK